MAAYKRRCADVFGALTLSKGSSLNQSSRSSLEEECLLTTGAESNLPGQSLREDHSRSASHSGIDVCSVYRDQLISNFPAVGMGSHTGSSTLKSHVCVL